MRQIILTLILFSFAFADAQEIASTKSETIGDTLIIFDYLGKSPTYLRLDSEASIPLDDAGNPSDHWTAEPHSTRFILTCHDDFMALGLYSNDGVRFGQNQGDKVRVVVQTIGPGYTFEPGNWMVLNEPESSEVLITPDTGELHTSLLEDIVSAEFVALTYYELNSGRYHRSLFSTYGLTTAMNRYNCKTYQARN